MTPPPPDVEDVVVLSAPPDPCAPDDPMLSASERDRCAAFRRPVDAARHATGRVLVRRGAAARLGLAPEAIGVELDEAPRRGRPRVVAGGAPAGLHVSIAHGGDVVLVALAGVPVGVDVERIDSLAPVVGSDVVFGPAERAVLGALAPPEAVELAARWWTAKEAVLKAIGVGLVEDPAAVDVRDALVHVRTGGCTTSWRVTDLATTPGHRAALATPAHARIDVRRGDATTGAATTAPPH